MTRRVAFRPAALADIEAVFDFFSAQAGAEVAARFFDAVFDSADALAAFPGRGKPSAYRWAARLRLRTWPVSSFPAVRLFYRTERDRVEIVRVLDVRRSLTRQPPP